MRGRTLHRLSVHQKQVTALSLYRSPQHERTRILSSSLDGTVRVIDPATYTVVHNFKFPDPVLAVAVSVRRTAGSHP